MPSDWMPGAIRRDGPVDKHGYHGLAEPSRKHGAVYHSAEGYWDALMRTLDDTSRRASWTFSNPKIGKLRQHYPVGLHTWANGSMVSNIRYTSCENEGVAGEALTPQQVDNLVALTIWLRDTQGWDRVRRGYELFEHNEMTRFGAAATACPSGRIPWQEIIERVEAQEDDDMALPFTVKLATQETWLIGTGDPVRVTDPVALAELRDKTVVAEGPSIIVSKAALRQLGVPASEIPA